ncbi:MAG: sensor histidine kinase [Ilumatobacteraceae bacterium]
MAERPAFAGRWIGTVRLRITVVATVAVAVVLIVAAFALLTAQRRSLIEQLDESLAADIDQVLRAVEQSNAGGQPQLLAPVGDDDALAQVVTLDGRVLAATANAAGRPPIAEAPTGETVSTIDGVDEPLRLVSRRDDERRLVVHVAAPLDDIDESIDQLRLTLAAAIPVVTFVLAIVVFVLVGRTLRPVELIRSEAAAIGPTELDRRLPQPTGRDEIARLAATMNAMLDRLEAASRRQQEFVADASHELRTPLTRMRAEIEFDLQHPGTADVAATSRSVLAEIGHLQQLVDDLLHLARPDADGATPIRRAVDLDDLVLEEVEAAAIAGVPIDAGGVAAVQIDGDAAQLRRVIRNVLDNAVRHAVHGVVVTTAVHDGDVLLTVTDDGPGVPPEHTERIFERFTTVDGARSPGRDGAGLGLAIARSIVEAHGGTIAIDGTHTPGARIIVRLPRR